MKDLGAEKNNLKEGMGEEISKMNDASAEKAKDHADLSVNIHRPDPTSGTGTIAIHEHVDVKMEDTTPAKNIRTLKAIDVKKEAADSNKHDQPEASKLNDEHKNMSVDAVEIHEGSLNATASLVTVTAPLHAENALSAPAPDINSESNVNGHGSIEERNSQLKIDIVSADVGRSNDADIVMKDATDVAQVKGDSANASGGDANAIERASEDGKIPLAMQNDSSSSVLPSIITNTVNVSQLDQTGAKSQAENLSEPSSQSARATAAVPPSASPPSQPQLTAKLESDATAAVTASVSTLASVPLKKAQSPTPTTVTTPVRSQTNPSSSGRGKKGQKSLLEQTFAPYILPSDRSLEDARHRLRTAIAQSLLLRKAFTERLYEKYRIILRPVPDSPHAITSSIESNPKLMHAQLLQQISVIQNEKEMEKKISQQINTELAGANNPIEMAAILGGLTGVENAEQLSWFGAGLNLVILPEEDVDEAQLAARGIKERAPVDPETGAKIRHLSSAAAVASSAMLDRVRKGSEIRRNRIRKQQSGAMGGDLLEMSMSYLPATNINAAQNISFVSPKRKTGRGDSSQSGKSSKGKSGKSASGSLTSLLNMSADAEGIRPSGKPSAVAFALMNNSLKKITSRASSSAMSQHPGRHPFPQSKGARSISYHMPGNLSQHPFALPNLSVAMDRKKKIDSLANAPGMISRKDESAHHAMKAVIHLLVVERPGNVETAAATDANGLPPVKRRRFGLKRKASEIGVLRNTRLKQMPKRDATGVASMQSKDNHVDEINPLLALSVMQSLGLIVKSSSQQQKLIIDDCITIKQAMLRKQIPPQKNGSSCGQKSEKTEIFSIDLPPDLTDVTAVDAILDPLPISQNERIAAPLKTVPIEIQVTAASPELPQQPPTTHAVKVPPSSQIVQQQPQQSQEPFKPSPASPQAFAAKKKAVAPVSENSAYVPSLRGGGGEGEDDSSAKDNSSTGTSRSSRSNQNSRQTVDLEKALWNRQDAAALSQDSSTLISPQHQAYAMMAAGLLPEQLSPNIYQQTSHTNGVSASMSIGALQNTNLRPITAQSQFRSPTYQTINNAQIQNQLQIQQAAAALQSSQFLRSASGSGEVDYFGTMRQVIPQGYTTHGHTDWNSLAAQQSILQSLPSATIDQAALGLSSHQAALLVRDRNAQVLLAREQQHLQAQVAAVHQNAAAAQMALNQATFLTNNSQQSYLTQHTQSKENGNARDAVAKFARSQSLPTKKTESHPKPTLHVKGKTAEKPKTNDVKIESSQRSTARAAPTPLPQSSRAPTITAPTTSAVSNGVESNTSKPVKEKNAEELRPKPKLPATKGEAKVNGSPAESATTKPSDNDKIKKTPSKPNAPQPQNSNGMKDTPTSKKDPVKTGDARPLNSGDARPLNSGPVEIPKKPSPLPVPIVKNKPPLKPAVSKVPAKESVTNLNTDMKMMIPARSTLITEKEAHAILKGHFHYTLRSVSTMKNSAQKEDTKENIENKVRLVNEALFDYLLKVGVAVPFPKTLVFNALKQRLYGSILKSTMISLSAKTGPKASPSDIIGCVISTWLWANYQSTFKAVFAKSGRIDVDPDCKWLIKAAVEKATDDSVARGLDSILNAASGQYVTNPQFNGVAIKIAKAVSSAMGTGISLDAKVNAAIPNIGALVNHLDELRMKAVRVKCQERVLLASLISKRTKMSEAFSNAYTSAMVRAGAALGYDDMGEIVQNESTRSSSQMPFDILSDSSGAWEDPCRPVGGYTANLDSDELVKRAHSRAMIQRSLKKLQDRHCIKGGTSSAGPYSDSTGDQALYKGSPAPSSYRPSPRSGSKRKASFSGAEHLRNMSSAASVALFNPTHYSSPFIWDADFDHNSPYGRAAIIPTNRNRSPSGTGRNLSKSIQMDPKRLKITKDGKEIGTSIVQSTKAIEWSEVAKLFEDVKPIEKTSSSSRAKHHDDHNVAVPLGSTILAPFCRKIDDDADLPSDNESDGEEEIFDDDHILTEHEKVLEVIKARFDTMMRIRQEYQDRSRRNSFGR